MTRPGLYILLLFLLQVNNLHGQTLIGAYGGFNYSSFFQGPAIQTMYYYEASFDPKSSFLLGMHYKRRTAGLFLMNLSLDYLLRNQFLDYGYGGMGGQSFHQYNVSIHSVNLRILPGIKMGKNREVYLNAGPYLGYIICSHKDGEFQYRSSYQDPSQGSVSGSAMDLFGGFDIGLCSTLGIEIPVGKTVLLMPELGFSRGLNNIGRGTFEDSGKVNSNNLYLTIGVVYSLE